MSELLASHNQSVMEGSKDHPFKNKIEPSVDTSSLASTSSSAEFSFLGPIEPSLRRLSVSLGLPTKEQNESDLDQSLFSHMRLPIENYEVTTILSPSQKEFCRRRCKNENGDDMPILQPNSTKVLVDPVAAVLAIIDQGQDDEELVAASPNQRNWKGISIAIFVIVAILASVAIAVYIKTPEEKEPRVSGSRFGIEHILDERFSPPGFNGSWISDTELLFRDATGGLSILTLTNYAMTQILSNTTFRRYNVAKFSLSPSRRFVLLTHGVKKRYRYSSFAHYSICELKTGLIWEVTSREEDKDSSLQSEATQPTLMYARWMSSPADANTQSGSSSTDAILFVEDYNIFYIPDVGIEEKKIFPLSQTEVVKPEVIFHGIPDWIYEEDILKRDQAIWVSPDATKIVYATFNDSQVQNVQWKIYGDGRDASVNPYPKEAYMRYPKAGTTNPQVTLWYVDMTDLNNLQYQEIRTPTIFRGIDYYFTAVSWVRSDAVAVIWMNRAQNISLVTECSPPTWICRITYREEVDNTAWSTLYSPPIYSRAGDVFLLLAPLRDGDFGNYAHIALIETNRTHIVHPLTFGHFEVEKILAWDEDKGLVYFQGIPENNPSQRHIYSTSDKWGGTQGPPKCITCDLKKEAENCTFNDAIFSPSFNYFVLECQGPTLPQSFLVEKKEGSENDAEDNYSVALVLNPNDPLKSLMGTMSPPAIEIVTIPVDPNSENTRELRLKFYYPPEMRKAEFIRFPLVLHVYSGPGSQLVTDQWKVDFNTYMSSGLSYIVMEVDGYGSGGQGEEHQTKIKNRLGELERLDQMTALKYARGLHFVDPDKIAVTGVSYGAYIATLMLAEKHQNFLACGVAVSPVVDWRFYESTYTERYMGLPLPSENFRGYQKSSLIERCQGIEGKEFFLAHGMADRNVHIQNSMILAKTLVSNNIPFEQHFYPDEDHYLSGVKVHLYESVTNFLGKCFAKFDPVVEE